MVKFTLNQAWENTSGDAYYPESYKEVVHDYYPVYRGYWEQEDKISKSFKLIQKLIDKKIIKEPKTVKDFIEIVNEVSEII